MELGRVRKILCSFPRSAGSVVFEALFAAGSYFPHADSFAIILGAFEAAGNGDIANWANWATSATDTAPAVGGMDLAVGAKPVWVTMEHTTKDGTPRGFMLREMALAWISKPSNPVPTPSCTQKPTP
jgi:acyl CoA:acetate/3-ketoacid CoA transferase beta subunit